MKFLQTKTFEARPVTAFIFNLLFSTRTWKIILALTLVGSLYLNYYLLRSQYVINCGVNGQVVAHLISQKTCDDLATAKFDALELYRQQTLRAMQEE